MYINIAAIGQMKKNSEADLCDRYITRLEHSAKMQGLALGKIFEFSESKRASAMERQKEEADKIFPLLKDHNFVILLDERGETLSSMDFASFLEKKKNNHVSSMLFVIGGPDGHYEPLRRAAQFLLSFGKMTLPHQFARILLVEQLYRVVTILGNHPYHRQ